MKKVTFLTTFVATVASLAWLPTAKAELVSLGEAFSVAGRGGSPELVTPGDTFSFDISGFNSAGTTGFLLTPALTATFGTTQTYTGVGVNGQNITITSSETISGLNTTDTFTVSTPTNFLTTATVNGTTITQLQFDLGNANSGSNTVDLLTPISTFTATGSVLFNTTQSLTLTPATTLSNNNLSYAAVEGVNAGTTAISGFAVRSFTYSITYATVPEPSSVALTGLGGLALLVGTFRLRRRQA